MRSKLKIVWLDDKLSTTEHEERRDEISSFLNTKGYIADYKEYSNYEEAKERLDDKSKRTDFFITDFNLSDDNGQTGLDYLIEIRQKEKSYKQFVILYSQREYNEIRKDILDVFGTRQLKNLNNFSFISLSDDYISEFKEAINIILTRWDELNAIRGRYMMVCSDIEYKLKKKFNCKKDFNDCIEKIMDNDDLKKNLHRIRNYRNALAHTAEEYDVSHLCYCLKSKTNTQIKIYENEIDKYKRELLEVDFEFDKWLKSPVE